ncbi:replication initiation and membrane attachment family protein [Brevibacillus sp. H7]|uniref:replication initiation and membrane attachment family protein n=1 Tax=Brevibacillus sp. H7 TaxID=3349138 RepID=UPI00380281DB
MRRLVWNELLPKDRYVVRMVRPISFAEMGFVAQLYLPVVGVESFALYQLLVHEVQETSGAAAESTHRGLMLMTSLPLDRLLVARERLEAMGLLEVRRRENQQRDYYYEYLLKPPLTPGEFFADYVLSLMLLNKIENVRYQQLRRKYADQLAAGLESEYSRVENLTKDFHEVFHSLKPSELEVPKGSERERFLAEMEESFPAAAMQAGYEASSSQRLNFSSLRINLPSNANPNLVLNGEGIEFLYKLMHFYQMDSWGLGQELSDWTLYKPDGSLDRDVLRKRLVQKYLDHKLFRETSLPEEFADALGPGKLPEPGGGLYARICRQLSPLSLLEQVVGGRVSKAFLDRAESLLFADGLPAEVVNVLLLHTLHSSQMELPKAYLETIRDSWKAKRISTVDEAMRQIMERADARNQAAEKAKRAKKETDGAVRRGGRSILQDKLPASVQRQLEKEKQQAEEKQKETRLIQDDPELKALLDALRRGE